MNKTDIMNLGIMEAQRTMQEDIGGPFGAVVIKDDQIISISSNHVLVDNDPTAHAEIMAIREACRKLGTYDLTGCELYATGYPCPMCLGAIMWSNIKKIYVSGLPEDCEEIGFRDDFMYNFIENKRQDKDTLEIEELDRSPAKMLYKKYAEMHKVIY